MTTTPTNITTSSATPSGALSADDREKIAICGDMPGQVVAGPAFNPKGSLASSPDTSPSPTSAIHPTESVADEDVERFYPEIVGDPLVREVCAAYYSRPKAGHFQRLQAIGDLLRAARSSVTSASLAVPDGFALVPIRMTQAMRDVTDEEGWQWTDVLAAAETVDEGAEKWYDKAENAIAGMEMAGYAWDGAEWRGSADSASIDPALKLNLSEERNAAEHEYTMRSFQHPDSQIGSPNWRLYWAGWLERAGINVVAVQPTLSAEREAAECKYTTRSFPYPTSPIGSHNWALYWAGWLARAGRKSTDSASTASCEADSQDVAKQVDNPCATREKEVVSIERKPTPAQHRWLRAIAAGQVTRNGQSWANGLHHACPTGWRKSTYVMTCDLHNAGWIDQLPKPQGLHSYPIVLTTAGRSAIGLDEEKQVDGSS